MTEKNKNWKSNLEPLLYIGIGLLTFFGIYYMLQSFDLENIAFLDIILTILIIIGSFFIHILLHELGHITGGLLSGYQFIMFRIFNTVWIKTESGLSKRKQNVPGILGQALMVPPERKDNKRPPFLLYHAGGIVMNLLTTLILLLINIPIEQSRLSNFIGLSAATAVILAVVSAIPAKGTDGYNILQQLKSKDTQDEMISTLYMYRDMVAGASFADMQKYITVDANSSFSDPNEVVLYSLKGAYYLEKYDFAKAREVYSVLWNHFDQLFAAHKPDITFSYLFTLLLTDPKHPDVNEIRDSKIYNQSFKVKQAEHIRTRIAMFLYLEENPKKAAQLLTQAEQAVHLAPTLSEEKLEKKLYDYLRREIDRKLV